MAGHAGTRSNKARAKARARRSVPPTPRTRSQSARPHRPSTRRTRQRAGDGPSATALAAEALRTGVLPAHQTRRRAAIPSEDETIRVGDPDDDSLSNEYVGDETPGGSASTPDQSGIDEIGRVYGLQEEGGGGDFHCAGEILARRDRRRAELKAPKKKRY
jgi:hypothetical protein